MEGNGTPETPPSSTTPALSMHDHTIVTSDSVNSNGDISMSASRNPKPVHISNNPSCEQLGFPEHVLLLLPLDNYL